MLSSLFVFASMWESLACISLKHLGHSEATHWGDICQDQLPHTARKRTYTHTNKLHQCLVFNAYLKPDQKVNS